MQTATATTRAPTIWWGLDIEMGGCRNFEETCKWLSEFKRVHLPNAIQDSEHKPHATVLYHGAAGAELLHSANIGAGLISPFEVLQGIFTRLERHTVGQRHFLTACFACERVYTLHARLREMAERISGAKSAQLPHLGPNGEHLYQNDLNLHVTVAAYNDRKTMDDEYNALLAKGADKLLLRLDGMPRFLHLGPLREHYG